MQGNESVASYQPCPDILLTFSDISAYSLAVLSPIVYLLVVYIVYFKSPSAMGAYKWYLILNATDIMGLEWIYAFAHPEPLFPYPVMLGRALASTIIVPDVLAKLYLDVAIALIICSYYCTMLLFLFRYCQTVDNWCHKLMSYRSYGIAISVVLLLFTFGTIIGPLHSQWNSRDEMLAYMRERDTDLYEKMLDASFVGFVRNESNAYFIAGVFATVLGSGAGAVIALSAFGCYYFLTQNRRKFSSRTIALYRTLINALVTDAALAFFMVFVPLVTSMASFQFQWNYSATTVLVSITIALWYPICTHLVLLTYVKPYRNAVIEIVRFSTVSMVLERRSSLRPSFMQRVYPRTSVTN